MIAVRKFQVSIILVAFLFCISAILINNIDNVYAGNCPSNSTIKRLVVKWCAATDKLKVAKVKIVDIAETSNYCAVKAGIYYVLPLSGETMSSPSMYRFMVYHDDFGDWVIREM